MKKSKFAFALMMTTLIFQFANAEVTISPNNNFDGPLYRALDLPIAPVGAKKILVVEKETLVECVQIGTKYNDYRCQLHFIKISGAKAKALYDVLKSDMVTDFSKAPVDAEQRKRLTIAQDFVDTEICKSEEHNEERIDGCLEDIALDCQANRGKVATCEIKTSHIATQDY